MAQVGRDLDLAQETLGAERVGQLGMQHLERDRRWWRSSRAR